MNNVAYYEKLENNVAYYEKLEPRLFCRFRDHMLTTMTKPSQHTKRKSHTHTQIH